jgi:hypothetical protein
VQKWSDLILFKSGLYSIFKKQNRKTEIKLEKESRRKNRKERQQTAWADPGPNIELQPNQPEPAQLPLPLPSLPDIPVPPVRSFFPAITSPFSL